MISANARYLGKVAGKRVFRVPVLIKFNDSRRCATAASTIIEVVAHSPAEAANWAQAQCNRPETEVFAYGPKGGETYRYSGYESVIGNMLLNSHYGAWKQGNLFKGVQ